MIGTLGKVGRAACMGSPVEGKRKARSVAGLGMGEEGGGWPGAGQKAAFAYLLSALVGFDS